MSEIGNFNPYEYESYDSLPEDQKSNYQPTEDGTGFVRASVLTEEDAEKQASNLFPSRDGLISKAYVDHNSYRCAMETNKALLESAPSGTIVYEVESEYYGSHPEYGEGDETLYVAIPVGTALPKIKLSHGHFSDEREDLALLPSGSYFSEGDEWEPVDSWRQPVAIEEDLPIPEGYVVVEATIESNWKPVGTIMALQPGWKAKEDKGKNPRVMTMSSLNFHSDVEYVEQRTDTKHWWEPTSCMIESENK